MDKHFIDDERIYTCRKYYHPINVDQDFSNPNEIKSTNVKKRTFSGDTHESKRIKIKQEVPSQAPDEPRWGW